MTARITESDVELLAIELLEAQKYAYTAGPEIAPDGDTPERQSYADVVLRERLRSAIDRINPKAAPAAREEALKRVLNPATQDLLANNEAFHEMLTNGIEAEYTVDGETRGDKIWLVDFDTVDNNDFCVCNQFTVVENNVNKRPDIILFVNGLPLVAIELKNPADENATVRKAFTQLQNYKTAIPSLFTYNSLLVASDGLDARAGTLSAGYSRFMAWKSIDGVREERESVPQLQTLIDGMLRRDVLLDLVRHFIVFERTKREDKQTGQITIETVKKVAAYHQYFAVNKAVKAAQDATAGDGSRKGGVVWHTQGSGKSLSMVFYTGKLVLSLDNPTIVVITDRNDLDDQLFDTFAGSRQLLRQDPVQAKDRDDLRKHLAVASGGIVFTTIQKFSPADKEHFYPLLSDRRNIVVTADEAHRSQYGFSARTVYVTDEDGNEVGTRTAYGFAKYVRDALPHATFVGFTGTPVEKEDKNTPAVFGDYVDIYDIAQAVEDEATVRIFYESRLAKVRLKDDADYDIDDAIMTVAEPSAEYQVESAKIKWARLEAIGGHPERLQAVARDLVDHYEKRWEAFPGKAMVVAMSRRIAVELYDEIVKLRPDWHDDDKANGTIKVVMTSSSSDPESWQKHHTTKEERKRLSERVKDPEDPLRVVIVRDMWLTGFDAPCLKTMYVDKPMHGHNLMQAIARVNRVYGDIKGGLIVDYIGIASDLKRALATYTEGGGRGEPTHDLEQAVQVMQEKYEVVCQLYDGFSYNDYFAAQTGDKLRIILEAQEHILGLDDGKNRYLREVTALSKAYALAVPDPRALSIKEEVGFFQAVKARLQKFESTSNGKSADEIDAAVRQIVDNAIVADGIIDVFDAAGIKKPDISILDEDFLQEIRGMKRRNLALELLKKLLNDEIKLKTRKNLVQGKKFSEMLVSAIRRYQNNVLSTAEVIEELIGLAKEMKAADRRGEDLGLNDDELAFYDALEVNDSAVSILGDEQLREIARVLVENVRKNASIDWTIKESVRAKLRVTVRRILRRYGYPPDMQKMAVDRILKQSEMVAEEWVDSPGRIS